jgi:hypothetical protein
MLPAKMTEEVIRQVRANSQKRALALIRRDKSET